MRNIINWNFERASWQWDLLCLLILAFIFLTPKEWFNNANKAATSLAVDAVKTGEAVR